MTEHKKIWAALSDGRYLRIFFNKNDEFAPLRFEDLPAYAELSYLMVNHKPLNAVGAAAKAVQIDYIQCHITFMVAQQAAFFNNLILIAPEAILAQYYRHLPKSLQDLMIGELAQDLIAESSDVIEQKLVGLIDRHLDRDL